MLLPLDFINWLPLALGGWLPGVWEQDIYTLPVLAGVALAMDYEQGAGKPLWPFDTETNFAEKNPSRHPGRTLALVGVSTGLAHFSYLSWQNPNFSSSSLDSSPFWMHVRGLMHAQLMTQIVTQWAKATWRRHRPFYDTLVQRGEKPVRDDSYSFFSGHAAHSACFFTYLSATAFAYAPPLIAWPLSSVYVGSAAWIAAARAIDAQHHTSDVLVGAFVGTLIASAVFFRVENLKNKDFDISIGISSQEVALQLSWQVR